MGGSETRYVPALRFRALTSLYDPAVRIASREATFKRRLIEIAAPRPGERVLDLGCGTGTLAIAAKRAEPRIEMVGVDGDPSMLERARAKADSAAVGVRFELGLSSELAFADDSFDAVLSTLLFHHLGPAQKRATAREIARVLRPGGRLLVADWGPPRGLAMRAAFLLVRALDGFEVTRENAEGLLPSIFDATGLSCAQVAGLPTATGSIAFYRATRRAAGTPEAAAR